MIITVIRRKVDVKRIGFVIIDSFGDGSMVNAEISLFTSLSNSDFVA